MILKWMQISHPRGGSGLLMMMLLVAVPRVSWAAFGDIVQTAVNDDGVNATVTATFGSNPTPGNLIISVAFSGDGPLTESGTLTEIIDHTDNGQDDGFSIGYRIVQTGDSTEWGWTQPSADQFAIINLEVEGPWADSPVDRTGTTAYADSPGTQQVSASGATTQGDEYVLAAWGFRDTDSSGGIDLTSVSDSFLNLVQEDNQYAGFQKSVAVADKVLTAADTPATTASFVDANTSYRTGALLVTFKKAVNVSTTHVFDDIVADGLYVE